MEKKFIVQLAIIILLSTICLSEDCSLFDQFVIDYNKEYKDDTEKEQRRQIFCENMVKLEELRKNNPRAHYGITVDSDRTEEELNRSRLFLI